MSEQLMDSALRGIVNAVYPVGARIEFETDTDPNTLYPWQTWTQRKGEFAYAYDDSHAIGTTGGEATHTLTTNEMPKHSHYIKLAAGGGYYIGSGNSIPSWNSTATTGYNDTSILGNSGDSQAHNNMPPYRAVAVWVRTA